MEKPRIPQSLHFHRERRSFRDTETHELLIPKCLNEKRNLRRIYVELHVTCASQKEETSRKDHWPISVCIKLGLGVRTIRGTLGNKRSRIRSITRSPS